MPSTLHFPTGDPHSNPTSSFEQAPNYEACEIREDLVQNRKSNSNAVNKLGAPAPQLSHSDLFRQNKLNVKVLALQHISCIAVRELMHLVGSTDRID